VANELDAALRAATETLTQASATPRLDAELLMAHALGLDRGTMLLKRHDLTTPDSFATLVARRAQGDPVAYICGEQEFWGLTFAVTPNVLIPRADSETLIEAAQAHFAASAPPANILDLGTGSGALLLTALSLFPEATGIGVDASEGALSVANRNAKQLGLEARATFQQRNWRDAQWEAGLGRFDLILCNPPYVEDNAPLDRSVGDFEPASALFAGVDGLDDYQILMPQISGLLSDSGIAIFELGKGQLGAVSDLAKQSMLSMRSENDLAGIARALILRRQAA
jgi:release factor glutamine methyltransferase